MDFNPDDFNPDFNPDDNDALVTYYIEAAYEAAIANQKKLAIRLYMAAFEQASVNGQDPSEDVLDGLGIAWDMACEIGDRGCADSISVDLMPYSSPDQNAERQAQLRQMASSELVQLGVPAGLVNNFMAFFNGLNALGPDAMSVYQDQGQPGDEGDANSSMTECGFAPDDGSELDPDDSCDEEEYDDGVDEEQEASEAGTFFDGMQGGVVEESCPVKKYDDLVGYDSELRQMCIYGFDAAGDQAYKRFIRQTSQFHGVHGLSLDEPFLFYGPSRDDVYEFAEATAGEIGNPVVSLHIRTDDEGMWTMRLSGPFKRGLFGVVDPTDVPMPCTFIVDNIDLLQEFIRASARSEAYGFDMGQSRNSGMPHGYNEILGYVHSMMSKPQVFAIATSATDIEFLPQLDELFSRSQKIRIDMPDFDERKSVWEDFAEEHASFKKIDLDELSRVSAGISRHDLVTAGRNAVRSAYKKSISNSDNEFVEIKDVLFEMVPFVPEGNGGSVVENAAAMAFASELDGMSFEMSGDEDEGLDPSGDTSSRGSDPRLGDIGLDGFDDPEE